MNAKDNPDGFLSHFLSLRNFLVFGFIDSLKGGVAFCDTPLIQHLFVYSSYIFARSTMKSTHLSMPTRPEFRET